MNVLGGGSTGTNGYTVGLVIVGTNQGHPMPLSSLNTGCGGKGGTKDETPSPSGH